MNTPHEVENSSARPARMDSETETLGREAEPESPEPNNGAKPATEQSRTEEDREAVPGTTTVPVRTQGEDHAPHRLKARTVSIQLAERMREEAGLLYFTHEHCNTLLSFVGELVADELANGNEVSLHKLGIVRARQKRAYIHRKGPPTQNVIVTMRLHPEPRQTLKKKLPAPAAGKKRRLQQ